MCASMISLPFQLAGLAMATYGTWRIWAGGRKLLPEKGIAFSF